MHKINFQQRMSNFSHYLILYRATDRKRTVGCNENLERYTRYSQLTYSCLQKVSG